MKAFEANLNAEDAPSRFSSRIHVPKFKKKGPLQAMLEEKRHEPKKRIQSDASHANIEKAISKGNMKAQEANLLSEEAPVIAHLKALRKKNAANKLRKEPERRRETKVQEAKEEGRDGPDTEKRDLQGRSRAPRSKGMDVKDAPGVSLLVSTNAPRRDPPKSAEQTYRSMAPTPRRKSDSGQLRETRDDDDPPIDDKYDQRAITQRLYGGTEESWKPRPGSTRKGRKSLTKSLYIGDLLDAPAPAGVSTDQSEDSASVIEEKKSSQTRQAEGSKRHSTGVWAA
jgi:hypothetical protein